MRDPVFASMQDTLQDALDDLASSRASRDRQGRALAALEYLVASACLSPGSIDDEVVFFALQETFECNVPSRLLAWIAVSTTKLNHLLNKERSDPEPECFVLSSQLSQALIIIQGIILKHSASKRYLGRRHGLEVLLDLLLASRHLGGSSSKLDSEKSTEAQAPLTSMVIDTLLCVLVDSAPAMRAFEDIKGVQAVVKLLKRAGTPREVRMKCLEFLYFYLLDETVTIPEQTLSKPLKSPPPFPSDSCGSKTAPSSPPRGARKVAGRFAHRKDMSDTSDSSTKTLFSPSGDDYALSSRACSSLSSRTTSLSEHTLPPYTLTEEMLPLESRGLCMLRQDLSFVPVSPRKMTSSKATQAVPGSRGHRQRLDSGSLSDVENSLFWEQENPDEENIPRIQVPLRTTEQKKVLLGELLGNVDSLVEGVRKAGVWGLG